MPNNTSLIHKLT